MKNKLLISLKLFDKNENLTFSTHSGKKKRILNFIRKKKFQKAYLKVVYQPGFLNDGFYCDLKSAEKALRDFTREEEIAVGAPL